jgi:hypothetical protein
MDAPSIADVPEHELVPLLLRHSALSQMVFAVTGSQIPSEVHFRVPFSALGSTEQGDVDALVFQSDSPELAAAYEFKRVKIAAHTFDTGTPNKLSAVSKAVQQANALERIGFSRIALVILVVTDGRERVQFNFAFRGATSDLLRTVDNAIDLSRLHPDIGVFRMEVMQPVDRHVAESGGISGKAYQRPKMRTQGPELTDRIRQFAAREART